MDEIVKSSDIISEVLFSKAYPGYFPRAYLVHPSIINKVKYDLHQTFTIPDWDYILQIGTERFEMHLIKALNEDQVYDMDELVINSQFSLPWEENPNLFIAADEFHIMEAFIYRYNLEAYILKIEEKLGHSVNGDHPIKVVSFNLSFGLFNWIRDDIQSFEEMSIQSDEDIGIINLFKKYRKGNKKGYLFVTNCLPWHEAYLEWRIRLNDNIYSVLPIILRHLGTLNYANDLDIMDLLSLRLAISDVRDYPSNPNLLNYEIDFMIKRILTKLIENNHLSLKKYLIANNIIPLDLLNVYLVYTFQHLFQTLDVDFFYLEQFSIPIKLDDTIKLKEEIDVLNKLKERFNVNYCIDGIGFDKMSLSLFVDLIELDNVKEIVLDTNYRWCNDVFISKHKRILPGYKEGRVKIYLRGENTYNFIESFTAELKTITLDSDRIILKIYCDLNDYRIFDNLKVRELIFIDIKIDLNMLQNLQQCAIKPLISLRRCSLENTSRNWQLLNNLEKLKAVNIYEDEGTWLSMFEFILKEIHKSNTNQFEFNSKLEFEIMEPGPEHRSIPLDSIEFAVDELNSKLEIRRIDTNEVVDLYCEKFGIGPAKKSDYEFYQ